MPGFDLLAQSCHSGFVGGTLIARWKQIVIAVKLKGCLTNSNSFFFFSDFLRKVYTLLSLQIILTTGTSALFMFSQTIKDFVHARWGHDNVVGFEYISLKSCVYINQYVTMRSPAVVLGSALGSLVLLLALAVYRHKHPVNLYLLLVFVSDGYCFYRLTSEGF